MSHTLPTEPHAFRRDLPKQAHKLEKETTLDKARHAAQRERRRHSAARKVGSSGLRARTQHGTSSGWSSASASEPAEGSDPEPAQTRILRQPFLDRAMGGGIARSCRAAAAAASVSQSSAQLCSAARVRFWSLGRNRTAADGRSAPSTARLGAPLPLPCLLAVAAVRLGTARCFLYFGRLLGPSAVYLHRVRLVYFRLLAAALCCTESTQNQLSSSRLLFAAVLLISGLKFEFKC